jgi:hypothetical protein
MRRNRCFAFHGVVNAQSGYKDYEWDYWLGVLAPANTSKKMVSQRAGWLTAALQAPRAKLVPLGLYSVEICGADLPLFSGNNKTASGESFARRISSETAIKVHDRYTRQVYSLQARRMCAPFKIAWHSSLLKSRFVKFEPAECGRGYAGAKDRNKL